MENRLMRSRNTHPHPTTCRRSASRLLNAIVSRRSVLTLTALLVLVASRSTSSAAEPVPAKTPGANAAADVWQAGVARVVITPPEPMWMSGYGGRDRPAEGRIHDLYARAAAFRDVSGTTSVFVSTDLIGVPAGMAKYLAAEVERQHGLPRRSLMLTCSHTHCGPAMDDRLSYMLDMKDADWQQVKTYQTWLNGRMLEVINAALADLQPARLSTGSGTSVFASPRRVPRGLGPLDHQVPVLKIETPDGSKLRGVVFGYACHNTTLSFYQWCGDYAGFAQLYLEDHHPDSVCMFFTGGGADQNPLPRRTVELAEQYGRMLATSVEHVLEHPLRPVTGRLRTAFTEIDLAFDALPTREQLEAATKSGSRYDRARATLLLSELDRDGSLPETWPYPVQVWQLGDGLTWVALGGELVVEYQIRVKHELGADRTWVTGYANDVMAYIPSERILQEGGYEGDSSMIVYQLPSRWKAGLENQILKAVHALHQQTAGAAAPSAPASP